MRVLYNFARMLLITWKLYDEQKLRYSQFNNRNLLSDCQMFKRCYGSSKEFFNSYELWRGHFKEIEGKLSWHGPVGSEVSQRFVKFGARPVRFS